MVLYVVLSSELGMQEVSLEATISVKLESDIRFEELRLLLNGNAEVEKGERLEEQVLVCRVELVSCLRRGCGCGCASLV